MPTEQQIKELAYSIWEQQGRPDGKDGEHYHAAQRILEEREASAAYVDGQEHLHVQYPGRKANNRPRRPKGARTTHPTPPYR